MFLELLSLTEVAGQNLFYVAASLSRSRYTDSNLVNSLKYYTSPKSDKKHGFWFDNFCNLILILIISSGRLEASHLEITEFQRRRVPFLNFFGDNIRATVLQTTCVRLVLTYMEKWGGILTAFTAWEIPTLPPVLRNLFEDCIKMREIVTYHLITGMFLIVDYLGKTICPVWYIRYHIQLKNKQTEKLSNRFVWQWKFKGTNA